MCLKIICPDMKSYNAMPNSKSDEKLEKSFRIFSIVLAIILFALLFVPMLRIRVHIHQGTSTLESTKWTSIFALLSETNNPVLVSTFSLSLVSLFTLAVSSTVFLFKSYKYSFWVVFAALIVSIALFFLALFMSLFLGNLL